MKIYMFHYVLKKDNGYHYFPLEEFEKKINVLNKRYNIVDPKDLYKYINSKDYSTNNVLLTFDDGTIDHYKNVYPVLCKNNLKALFFICGNIFDSTVLNVQKIHKLLSTINIDILYDKLQGYLCKNNISINRNLIIKGAYEADYKIIEFKSILQHNIKKEYRDVIIDHLLKEFNIEVKYEDIYMSLENIQEMKMGGMSLGLHTMSHERLGFMDVKSQEKEILSQCNLFNKYLIKGNNMFLSFPYGHYNQDTIKIIKDNKINFAFTVENREFTAEDSWCNIPRLDCNNLRKEVII